MVSSDASLRVVGVGASAGGLESLEKLFSRLPTHSGLAFVVVQHLSPHFRSMMDELLARRTDVEIRIAEDGVQVHADCIYLLPPGKELLIRDGRLVLKDQELRRGVALPIDQFFRSLAKDLGSRAVAVVLSGSGSDGSRGIRDVHRAGGTVIVESPETAKFDGMPLSALATSMVHHVCRPEEIVDVLLGEPRAPTDPLDGTEEGSVRAILSLIQQQFGMDFAGYKAGTVTRRIWRRCELLRANSLDDYLVRLEDPDELGKLYHDLLIGVTEFFRDPEAFEVLEKRIIPELLSRVPPNEDVRVWVAGCATGEEAYSIALLLHEQMCRHQRPVRVKLLATDAHRPALGAADAGVYAESQLVNVSQERRERYFALTSGGYRITPELRDLVVFAAHNLLNDPPFTRMHLITCRNLLIYLEPHAQKRVLSRLHFGLTVGGVLMLGSSENLGQLATEFEPVDEQRRFFRKRRDVNLLDSASIVLGEGLKASRPTGFQANRGRAADTRLLAIYDRLLDQFMPPSFLVSEDLTLVDSFGNAEQLLHVVGRRPSNNLLDMIDERLRPVVVGAVGAALRKRHAVQFAAAGFPEPSPGKGLIVAAEPIVTQPNAVHVLITMSGAAMANLSGGSSGPDAVVEGAQARAGGEASVQQLEFALSLTRENLQAAVEELQTSNEELQATNEELVASHEELQSTNEELHSVNEELYTVNAEYQKKISELRELNNDIQHLLDGTDVGILFLDPELNIRKYTPRIASVFRILPHDVGRSIRDISHNLRRPGLVDEIAQVLGDGEPIEDEVRSTDGATLFLRILPYHPDEGEGREPGGASVSGVVVTATDISALDAARDRLDRLSAIVESSDDAIIGKDLSGTVVSWNGGAERLYGYSASEVLGRDVRFLVPEERRHEVDEFLDAIRRGESVEHVETVRLRKDGTRLEISLGVSPIRDRQGVVVGASAIARDITPLRAAHRELARQKERMQMLLDSTAEAIYGLDGYGICTFANWACARMLGYSSPDELVGKDMHPLIHYQTQDGSPYPLADCPIFAVLRSGRGAHSADEVMWRKDGTSFATEYWSYPICRGGHVEGAVVTFLDITERKRAEAELLAQSARREQFLAMLSHELRNPLSAVLNSAQLLRRVPPDRDSAEHAREVIERQAGQMSRLLDDLLDVTRITRGRIVMHKQVLDLRAPIREAVDATRSLVLAECIELHVELPDNEIPVRADPARMQQVALNLLSNAFGHSGRGQRVSLKAWIEGEEAIIEVTDEGEGIDPELLPRIFDLFVQRDQSVARPHGGLGVGLTVVKSIVEAHEGSVFATSGGAGQGSTFRVTLPLERVRVQDTGEMDARSAELPRNPLRVLIVEDQDDARETLRMLLEVNGHQVLEATDGQRGLALIEQDRPDVAIVDVGLPGLSGWEVAERVRAQEALSGTRLIALTGYGAVDDVQRTLESGFDHHLTKPAQIDQIEALLGSLPRQ